MELSMHTLLSIAKENHASDVHITVGVRPKCRISGTLYEMDGFERLTPAMTQQLVESMFGPKQKQTMEEVGEVDFAYSDPSIGRFRVNAFHQRGSYAAVLRIVASDIPAPDQLGVPESVLGLTKKKRGLVLVTGPTGSGKSTTLASLIDVINKERNEHIITLEDPIEYLHKHIRSIVNQREIGLDTDSYGNALRAALREDPDIILVGEMRDFDTISCMPSFLLVCMIDGIWCALSSRIRFLIAGVPSMTSNAATLPLPSMVGRSCCEMTASRTDASCERIWFC